MNSVKSTCVLAYKSSQYIGRRFRRLRLADVQTLLILAFVSLVSLCPNRLSAEPVLPLHTSGAYLVDADGARVRLNAFSWYGAESKDFVVAGLQIADLSSTVQVIKSLGFNTVRLPWSNELFESNPVVDSSKLIANPSLRGKSALAVFDEVIGALTKAGIMVILDNHNSNAEWCCGDDGNTLWYNSAYPEANWLIDWKAIAARYKSNPLVIGADLRNEPRVNATWGGNASTDWHAAAQRGGNAVLAVNPDLLIFVEGIDYSLDLSGVASNPVQLNVGNHLVYSPHDYSYDYSNLSSFSDYANRIGSRWGYLVSGSHAQPVWMGEFGTCNRSISCVASTSRSDNGLWFNYLTTYLQQHSIGWSYWAINGTQSTGSGRMYGAAESYGVLNPAWNGTASAALTTRLGTMISGTPGFVLLSSGNAQIASTSQDGSTGVTVVPQNGFVGTIILSCTVANSTASAKTPTCTVPSSISMKSADAALVTVNLVTSAANRKASAGTTSGTYLVTVYARSRTTSSNVQFNVFVQ